MKENKGFTLIELVIVVAILAILSIFSIINITNFQKSAEIESTARELSSSLESARSKSISGQINEGKTAGYYDPDYLPVYGIKIESDKYSLTSKYRLAGSTTDTIEVQETLSLDSSLTLSPSTQIDFARRTGTVIGTNTLSLTQSGTGDIKQLTIFPDSIEILDL